MRTTCTVKALTLFLFVLAVGCSSSQPSIYSTTDEFCKNRAYLRVPLDAYISQRFPKGSPLRVGIVPFSSQANLAARNDMAPGLGFSIARGLREQLLAYGTFPIIEVLPRADWPGKYLEFDSGNFEAISMAKNAGYDFVLIGAINQLRSLDELSARAKLIEAEGGITVWSGEASVSSLRRERADSIPFRWLSKNEPSRFATNELMDMLPACLAASLLSEEPVPAL